MFFKEMHPRFLHAVNGISYESLPKITIPIPIQNKIKKIKRERQKKELDFQLASVQRGKRDSPIISSKNKRLNHYMNQTYSKFANVELASKGWFNRKSCGDYFTINSFKSNPIILKEDVTFNRYNFHPHLVKVLSDLGYIKPTKIQDAGIPPIMNGECMICCGQTGSGKTLTYLLPIINKLYVQSHFGTSESHKDKINTPKTVILTPSRELATQVSEVATDLCEKLNLKVLLAIGGANTKKSIQNPEFHFGLDILISTPGVLKKYVSSTIFKLDQVQHLVLDEVDTLLDESFSSYVSFVLKNINWNRKKSIETNASKMHPFQLLLIGATMPTNIQETVGNILDINSFVDISGENNLHYILPHITQKFLRIKSSDRPTKLLYELHKSNKINPTIIFAENSKTCHWLHKFLQGNKVPNIEMHADMSFKAREGRFESFQNGFAPVLTCTDLGSRGLDTTEVHRVINFNFPSHVSDYIHRVGRVGRIGSASTGSVLNFISKKWEISMVQKIELSCRKNTPLQEVNANIKKIFMDKIDQEEMMNEDS